MAMTYNDAIRILGLSPRFVDADLRGAYRQAARKNHPDHGGSDAEFIAVSEAYQYLNRRGSVGAPWHSVAWNTSGGRVDADKRLADIEEVSLYAAELSGWRGTVAGHGIYGFQLERLHGIWVGIRLGVSVSEAKVSLRKLHKEYQA